MRTNRNKTYKALTLIEMIVTIGIFLLGIQAFTLLVMRTWELNHYIMEEGEASFIASRAASQISEDIREATLSEASHFPIVSGNDTDLVLYADVDEDGKAERVHYYLDTGAKQLKRGVTEPVGTPATYASGDDTTTVIANFVVNSVSEPIFTYYNGDYPGDMVNNPLVVPVTPSSVKLIRVLLVVNITPNRAPDETNIETFAELRNLHEQE